MASTISPNMNLIIPTVGSQPGPDYASNVNDSLTLIDTHDHTPGKGVALSAESFDINSALTLNDNFLTDTAGVNFTVQSTPPSTTGTIYELGVDLYYKDGLGNVIQITQNGALAGTPGSIADLTPPASAAYVSGSSKFVWQSNTNIAADMDFGAAILRNISPNSTYSMRVQPPSNLVANSTLTLPLPPVATSFLTMSSAGVITATPALLGALTTSNLSSSAGIVGTQLASETITKIQLNPNVFEWNVEEVSSTAPAFTVRVATTVNGTLATAFDNASVVDGITLATSDLILVKNQTTNSENGVYVVQASGSPTRSTSYDTAAELSYASVTVTAGTRNAGSSWYQNYKMTSLTNLQLWTQGSTEGFTVPDDTALLYLMGFGGGGGGGSGATGSTLAGGAVGRQGGSGGQGSVPLLRTLTVAPAEDLKITVGAAGRGGLAVSNASAGSSLGNAGEDATDTIIFREKPSFTGNRTSASPIVSGIASTAGLSAGYVVIGLGFPTSPATKILSVDSGTQVTLTNNATSGSGASTDFVSAEYIAIFRGGLGGAAGGSSSGAATAAADEYKAAGGISGGGGGGGGDAANNGGHVGAVGNDSSYAPGGGAGPQSVASAVLNSAGSGGGGGAGFGNGGAGTRGGTIVAVTAGGSGGLGAGGGGSGGATTAAGVATTGAAGGNGGAGRAVFYWLGNA